MVLGEMDGHKTEEVEEQFLNAPGEPALEEGAFLYGSEFEQEQPVSGAEVLAAERMVGREEVAPDNAHQFQEMTEVVRRQRQARLAQLGRDSNFFPLFAGFPLFSCAFEHFIV